MVVTMDMGPTLTQKTKLTSESFEFFTALVRIRRIRGFINMTEFKLRITKTALFLLACVVCLSLSIAAYNKAIELVNSGGETAFIQAGQRPLPEFFQSPFKNQRVISLNGLAEQRAELNERLEYMVWPAERADLQQRIDQLHQQGINAIPFRGRFWAEMLNSKTWQRASDDERYWMLDKSAKLLKWNLGNNYILARPCAQFFEDLAPYSAELCPQLLSKLPYQRRFEHTAQQMGVSQERFNKVLTKSGLLKDGAR